jgi:hypothetical protein
VEIDFHGSFSQPLVENIYPENIKSGFKIGKKDFNPTEGPPASPGAKWPMRFDCNLTLALSLLYDSAHHSLMSILEFNSTHIILN